MAQSQEGGYYEDFEGSHYDGTSYLPQGWATTGEQPFYTLSWYTLPAHSGRYYAISIDINNYSTSVSRNEWMYTCSFALEKNVEYSGSFWIHNDSNGPCTTDFCVGKTQSPESQRQICRISGATDGDWEEVVFSFTPDETGYYFFGWNVTSPDRHTTFVAIDDFAIMQAWMVNLPTAEFAIPHIYNISTSSLITYPGQGIKLDNVSEKATSYKWECDNSNATFSDDTDAEPTIYFKDKGKYTVTLHSINESGIVSTSHTINVELGNELNYYGVSTYDSMSDELIQRGTIPTFKTDLDYDFITGPNHLYREFAERYAFAEGATVKLHTINVFLTEYSLRTDQWSAQQNVPFEVIVYGEKDGRPDEGNIYGKFTTTVGKALGTTGVGGTAAEPRNITIDNPITINGPAYVSFRIGDDFSINDDGAKIVRSYMAFAPIRRVKTSTMVVKPYYLPSGIATPALSLGDWCTAAQLDADMPEALGMYNILWVSYDPTGIDNHVINNTDDRMFSITGQRLTDANGYRGVIIKNGKKIIKK